MKRHDDSGVGHLPDLRLTGKVALVTGASRGIGKAIALTFAEAGADLALAARSERPLQQAASEIRAQGGKALAIPCDVLDPGAVQRMIDLTVERLGRLDILVNNAGMAPLYSSIEKMDRREFEQHFAINFNGAVNCIRASGPILTKLPGRCVLNVASVAGLTASPGLGYYSAAKAALINLTKTLAREWAKNGVRVNALAPGWIDTDLSAGLKLGPDAERAVLASIPLGRTGKPEDVAWAALFLCSPAAGYITGSVLVMDGGETA